jgi:aminoglycoside phosphotransferase (APT) family kinase protein
MSRQQPPTTTSDTERLKAAIRASYAAPVDTLQLVASTDGVDSYVGRTGRWQFGVTAWTSSEPDVRTLRLQRWLSEQHLSFGVPTPMATIDDDVLADCDGVPFIVFDLVYGRSMEPYPAWTAAGRDDQARVLAAIHSLTPPDDLLPPLDDVGCTPVLCNSAFHGDNIVVKRNRVAGVLDWTKAVLGPPELDLHIAVLGDVRRFLDVYAEAGGTRDLHVEHFALALGRRGVEGDELEEQLEQISSALEG